jgi:hypothetical protein
MKDALINIIEDGSAGEYSLFKEYCIKKEKWLRKDSFSSLDRFIKEANGWEFETQKRFVLWLFQIFEESDNLHNVLVHPLEQNLLKPVLENWMTQNTNDPRPYRWYGLFLNSENAVYYLNKALEIGELQEQRVILKLIDIYFYGLWYSFHHISESLYLGNVDEDFETISMIESLNEKVASEEDKLKNLNGIKYYRCLIADWIEFKEQECEDFVRWCANKSKEYQWVKSYYY